MQHVNCVLEAKDGGAPATVRVRPPASGGREWDHVARGNAVFRPGEQRRLYRIEDGAVCHFGRWADPRFEVIECAFAGDIIGLGYLPAHTSLAVAMVDTLVSRVSPEEFAQAVRGDDQLAFRLADAGEREFEHLREKSLTATGLPPLQRLANYLLATAHINGSDSGDGTLIREDVTSAYVAGQLSMTIETLAMALFRLRRSGLLEVSPHGVHIVDMAGLEAIAASA